jgi:hypothetical protein
MLNKSPEARKSRESKELHKRNDVRVALGLLITAVGGLFLKEEEIRKQLNSDKAHEELVPAPRELARIRKNLRAAEVIIDLLQKERHEKIEDTGDTGNLGTQNFAEFDLTSADLLDFPRKDQMIYDEFFIGGDQYVWEKLERDPELAKSYEEAARSMIISADESGLSAFLPNDPNFDINITMDTYEYASDGSPVYSMRSDTPFGTDYGLPATSDVGGYDLDFGKRIMREHIQETLVWYLEKKKREEAE